MSAVVVAVAARFAPAATPATVPTTGPTTRSAGAEPANAATLIRQLDADDWQARNAAGEQLVGQGEAVRAAVADAAEHADSPEVRARAAGVIARMDQAAGDRPTRVTFHLADVTPREVFAELGRQSGAKFQLVPPAAWGATRVSIDVVDQPFWAAVDAACDKCGGAVQPFGRGGGELTVLAGNAAPLLRGPQSTFGQLTVVARSYSRSRQVTYADGSQAGSDTVELLTLLDPKLRPAEGADPQLTILSATDDRGGTIEPVVADRAMVVAGAVRLRGMAVARAGLVRGANGGVAIPSMRSFNAGPMRSLIVGLKPPSAGATRIAVLKGTLTMTVVGQGEQLRIDDAGHAAAAGHVVRGAGQCVLELERCDVTDRGVSYAVTVVMGNAAGLPGPAPDVRLEDADGNAITGNGGSRSINRTNGQVRITTEVTTAEPVRQPVRIVWDVATRTRSVTLPFELHDLAVPQP